MELDKLARNILVVGLLGCGASIVWWYQFYSHVGQFMNGRTSLPPDAINCLISNSGVCGFVTGVASAAGAFAYNPMIMWLSMALVLVAIIVWFSSGSPGHAMTPPATPGNHEAQGLLNPEVSSQRQLDGSTQGE